MKRLVLLLTAIAQAQTPTPAPAPDTTQLADRTAQLMESTAAVVPGLGKASAPISENARQTVTALKAAPNNSTLTYQFLNQARAYLALLDAMPKPYPLPETARKQILELRDSVERLDNSLPALLDRKELQLRNPDRDNLHRYAEEDARLNPPTPNFTRIVFLGDSITDAWRLNEYLTGRDYVNRGISGQITGEMLGRMKADVIDLHPRAMLILAGTNDIARGIALRTIENNLDMIGQLCRFNHIIPLFASILPVNAAVAKARPPAAIQEVNRWLQDYTRAHNEVYVDYWSALKDNNGLLPADLSDDGLHPNARGYRLMAPVAVKALDEALSERSPQQQPPVKKRRGFFSQSPE